MAPIVVLIGLVSTAPARGQTAGGPVAGPASVDADAAIAKGIEYRRGNRDREALAEFQRAAAIQKTPRAQAQIALAEQALGLWVRAEAHLLEALGDRDDVWIQKNGKTLEDALHFVQSHLGSVEVWGSPVGAEVLLDGQAVGTLPMDKPARVANSEVTLQVRAKGFATITRTLAVPRGQYSVREQVDLHPLLAPDVPVAAVAPAVATPASASSAGVDLRARAEAGAGDGDAPRPLYRKTWFWLAVGAGVVAVAVTGVLLAGSKTDYPSSPTTSTFNNPGR